MSIFLLRKPDGSEKLISLKNISTLEDAYAALKGSESVRGCVITTAKPEPDTLTTWLLTLKEYGVDIKSLAGHTDDVIMQKVTTLAYDLGLAVSTLDYDYKIKTQFGASSFDIPHAQTYIGNIKDSIDLAIKNYYIFADNKIQIGIDSKDSSKVTLIINGTVSVTAKKDSDSSTLTAMNDELKATTESVLHNYKLINSSPLSITINPVDELNPRNKAKRKLRLHF
jgi:hypothetical protein